MMPDPSQPWPEQRLLDPASLEGRPLIVVGDAHLHEEADPSIADDLARLIGSAPENAAIVFNGDLFDLDRVHGDPRAGVGQTRAARRLVRVLDRHPSLTASLRRHLASGGSLLFIAGNHDAELLLPRVSESLIQRLGGDPARVRVIDRVLLRRVAIEHGHQTDPDAAFFPDTRGAVGRERLSAYPLACLMTRLFVSEHPRYEAAGLHYEAPLSVFLSVLRNYKLAGLWMAIAYPFVAIRITWHSLLACIRGDVPKRPSALSMSSPWQVARRLYLDRYFTTVGAIALLIALAAGWIRPGFWWLFGFLAAYLAVPPIRRRSAFGERDLRTTAEEAARLAAEGASVIVFGHTHRAFVQHLGEAVFANHGAFSIPVEIDEQGTVCAGGKPAPRSLDRSRKARPYLAVTVDPPTCDLRGVRLQDSQGSARPPAALM